MSTHGHLAGWEAIRGGDVLEVGSKENLARGFIVGVDLVGFREHCELVIFHERDGMTERHLLVIDCKSRMV